MICINDTKTLARFWAKVDKSGDCWIWTAGCCKGYGLFRIKRRMFRAHRVAWMLTNGPIPDGLHVLHDCDNPPCVNPGHLFLGTNLDNSADMVLKGRESHDTGHLGEENGLAKLNPEKVRSIRDRVGSGELSRQEAAIEYGVCYSRIGLIINRKTWIHI